jgi:hypothetical protein
MTRAIGVEVGCPFTPAMLRKVAYAGSQSASFVQATKDLDALGETRVSRERVQRWTKRVGQECVQEAAAQADAYRALPLPEQRKSPTEQVPQVACVMMDGGRIQVRDRREEPHESQGYWKETLVGCCPTGPPILPNAARRLCFSILFGFHLLCDKRIEQLVPDVAAN